MLKYTSDPKLLSTISAAVSVCIKCAVDEKEKELNELNQNLQPNSEVLPPPWYVEKMAALYYCND